MATLNFNANEVDPPIGYEPIPAGKYVAIITHSQMRPTRSGDGNYLELTFQIVDGEHKGRMLWSRLNLDNPKAETVKYARAELSAICRAVGVMAPRDSSELHNLPLVIKVAYRARKDTGETINVIKGYAKHERGNSVEINSSQGVTQPPWKR